MIEREFLTKGQKKIPGIYGGMGPLAHIQFEQTLIQESTRRGNKTDQEHPVYIVFSGSSTPDRTKSLQGGPEAQSHMITFGKHLEKAGADFLVMTCNTAHAYIDALQEAIDISVISLIDETAKYIKETSSQGSRIGIMATSGTIHSKLYDNALEENALTPIAPNIDSDIQGYVMDAIYNPSYGIKATGANVDKKAREQLFTALSWYQDKKADAIILGCTELSVALKQKDTQTRLIDPLQVLAEKTLDIAFDKNI